ncbi:hypothetical protein JHV675_28220 [Mycobacterium avium subsp. hominissuis]
MGPRARHHRRRHPGGGVTDEDEWRAAVADMSEMDRAVTEYECRRALGLCGDREDARYE